MVNVRKHGVSFEIALHVFDDPDALVEQDRVEDGEHRWQTPGSVEGVLLLLVAHTVHEEEEDEVIRIISARKADGKERRRYEKERQEKYGGYSADAQAAPGSGEDRFRAGQPYRLFRHSATDGQFLEERHSQSFLPPG
jgi:uncharacterized DUF497 family protein